jgi:hypothetical protein
MDLAAWAADEARRRLAGVGTRWAHCDAVASGAEGIAVVVDPEDRSLLIAAAYLHDVGYAPELVVSGFHPLDGGRWLRELHLDRLAGLVAHHTGARFEARALGFEAAVASFADEESAVSDALTYCDLTTGPAGERVGVSDRLDEIEHRYGSGSVVVQALDSASRTLAVMVERTEQRLLTAGTTPV